MFSHPQINLTGQRVLYATKLGIKNDGKANEEAVTICLPASLYQHAALVHVGLIDAKDASNAERLKAKSSFAPPSNASPNVVCAHYLLPSPLQKGQSAKLVIEAVLTHALRPRPATIQQSEHPRYLYTVDTAYTISPYPIQEDTTNIRLNTKDTEAFHAPEPAAMDGKSLVLGPYKDIKPFTVEPLDVHFISDFPMLVASRVTREISISHWGRVFVDEQYDVSNHGAKIEGEWSRFEVITKRDASLGAAPQFPTSIPGTASGIYFQDELGNISSTVVKRSDNRITVGLVPRYPLFGGWRIKFDFGYSVPLSTMVGLDETRGKYVLFTQANPSVKDVVVDELVIKVVLPEGASDPHVEMVLPHDIAYEKKYTYFDVFGRQVAVVTLHNVVPESNDALAVAYKFSSTSLAIKPLVLSAAFALLFAAFVGINSGGSPSKLKTV